MSIEFLSAIVGFTLTLMIFSYLIGDNPLFRIAVYLFIGVSSGYAATVVWHSVLMPKLIQPLADPAQLVLLVIPLILSVSLLAKLSPHISWIGNFAMAMMVGVGAATAVGGALVGTLLPQAWAAVDAFDLGAGGGLDLASRFGEAVIMLAGTVLTLAAFHFGAKPGADGTPKRNVLLEWAARIGRLFIAITFGVLFAGVYMAALTAMIERLSSILTFLRQLVGF